MERFIAIDDVCAWPNLTLLPNGDVVATIFNQPCHGRWQGDVECWASTDGGRKWNYRGTPAPHDPETNRMNVAAGLCADGDLMVVASGWSDRPTREQVDSGVNAEFKDAMCLEPWVCRSSDGGASWTRAETFSETPESGMIAPIPFGDVLPTANGLFVSAYAGRIDSPHEQYNSCYFYKSDDDGQTWNPGSTIDAGSHNETSPVHLGDSRWLAAARRVSPDSRVDLFRSEDDGATWEFTTPLSLGRQHPAHLLRLADGRILLTYGNRCRGMWGVDARLSNDDGETWSAPAQLIELNGADLGYPSSVQTEDGNIVTAYYLGKSVEHHRYHMGVQIWGVDEIF